MMGREIKFRAWNYKLRKMDDVFNMDIGGVCSPEQLRLTKQDPLTRWAVANCVLMQYTGLKDSSDPPKEIYEGDILKCDQDDSFLQVLWNFENVQFVGKWLDNYRLAYEEFEAWIFKRNVLTNFEIIGNIYENPELLD